MAVFYTFQITICVDCRIMCFFYFLELLKTPLLCLTLTQNRSRQSDYPTLSRKFLIFQILRIFQNMQNSCFTPNYRLLRPIVDDFVIVYLDYSNNHGHVLFFNMTTPKSTHLVYLDYSNNHGHVLFFGMTTPKSTHLVYLDKQ